MEIQIVLSSVVMNRYIVSRISASGKRQWLKRALPSVWVDYECLAVPFSGAVSEKLLAFQKRINPHGVYERQIYRPPKLPKGEASPK